MPEKKTKNKLMMPRSTPHWCFFSSSFLFLHSIEYKCHVKPPSFTTMQRRLLFFNWMVPILPNCTKTQIAVWVQIHFGDVTKSPIMITSYLQSQQLKASPVKMSSARVFIYTLFFAEVWPFSLLADCIQFYFLHHWLLQLIFNCLFSSLSYKNMVIMAQ